ncbi:AGE family epimerase/isomerase [Paenibacillus sp. GCM10027626]|uniref:AGE family epimerase/isomerase n=1 Tax=Paenibacillus sp. GCM10027626 TaxID=3273411 RepID=UPI00362BF687
MNKDQLVSFYRQELNEHFIPYWEDKIDMEYGGVFSCISNTQDEVVSTRKYIWSQGRFLWMAARLLQTADRYGLQTGEKWREGLEKTYQLLRSHAKMDNGHIVNAVERNGAKIEEELDVSIFADCFYILGMNAYAEYNNSWEAFDEALAVYQLVAERIEKWDFKSDPYPIPEGFESHSIPMILINVAEELYQASKLFGNTEAERLTKNIKQYFTKIVLEHAQGERIVEMLPADEKLQSALIARHVNPGHTLECIWFLKDSLHHFEPVEAKKYSSVLEQLAMAALEQGWDKEYGGLLRFVDCEGGKPSGTLIGTPLEQLIQDTWDTKLWWPHSEALYTTLMFTLEEGERKETFAGWYNTLHEYVFSVFPAASGMEWTQIRNRQGDPLSKVVALPVKDPFHIIRNFLLTLRLLAGDTVWRVY